MAVSVISSRGPSDTAAIDAEKPKPHGICERIASCIRRVFQSIWNGIKFIFSGCGLCRDTYSTLLAEARKDTSLGQYVAIKKISAIYLNLREQFFQLEVDFIYFERTAFKDDNVNIPDVIRRNKGFLERNDRLAKMRDEVDKLEEEVLNKIHENIRQKKIRLEDHDERLTKYKTQTDVIACDFGRSNIGGRIEDVKWNINRLRRDRDRSRV